MTVEEFLTAAARTTVSRHGEIDALRAVGALEDAALLDLRMSGVWSVAWLLFDCKGALNVSEGNTAVLVVRGLRGLSWTAEDGAPGARHRAVETWEPVVDGTGWRLRALLSPEVSLELSGRGAEFYVGDVPGADDAAPDYGREDDATIRTRLASWDSPFDPYYAATLG